MRDRGEMMLAAIYDDVDRALNPEGAECRHCGGEGYVHDCIDGFCSDSEVGCEDCTQRCPECVIHDGARAKAVRKAVVMSGDVELAAAWLKSIGRWTDDITMDRIGEELDTARRAMEREPA